MAMRSFTYDALPGRVIFGPGAGCRGAPDPYPSQAGGTSKIADARGCVHRATFKRSHLYDREIIS